LLPNIDDGLKSWDKIIGIVPIARKDRIKGAVRLPLTGYRVPTGSPTPQL